MSPNSLPFITYSLAIVNFVNSETNGQKFPPLEPLHFCPRAPHFAPPHCPSNRGQNPERKTPFPFSKEISPPPNQESKECFSFGVSAESARRWGGAIRRAYDFGQSHHALRACLIQGSAGNESELFGIMTTPDG